MLVLLQFRVQFSFISPVFRDIQPRLCLFSSAFVFLHLVSVGQQLFRRTKQKMLSLLNLYDDEKYKTNIVLKKVKVFHLIICIFSINGEN